MIIYEQAKEEGIYTNKSLCFSSFNEYKNNILLENPSDTFRLNPPSECCVKYLKYVNSLPITCFMGVSGNFSTECVPKNNHMTPLLGEIKFCSYNVFGGQGYLSTTISHYPFNMLNYDSDSNFKIRFCMILSPQISGVINCTHVSENTFNHSITFNTINMFCCSYIKLRCTGSICQVLCNYLASPFCLDLCRHNCVNSIYINGVCTNETLQASTNVTIGGCNCHYCVYTGVSFYPSKIEVLSGNVKYLNIWNK